MSDLFDDIAKNHVPAEPEFEDLPPKVWCLGQTATEAQGGAAAGTAKVGDDEKDYWQFRVGLVCEGGEEGKLEKAKHANRFCFYSTFILPSEEYDKPEALVSGKFAGFLNTLFSSGVGEDEDLKTPEGKENRRVARWNNTIKTLQQVSKDKGLGIDDFQIYDAKAAPSPAENEANDKKNKALFLAGLAVAAMETESYSILFKTKLGKPYERDGVEVQRLECGAVEDATEGNKAKRKIVDFETGEVSTGSTF